MTQKRFFCETDACMELLTEITKQCSNRVFYKKRYQQVIDLLLNARDFIWKARCEIADSITTRYFPYMSCCDDLTINIGRKKADILDNIQKFLSRAYTAIDNCPYEDVKNDIYNSVKSINNTWVLLKTRQRINRR